jgi:hypothetical protein
LSNALDLTQTKPPPGLRPSGGAGGQDRCSFRLKARPCHRSRRSAILIRNHKSQSWTSIGNDRTKESRGATGTRRGSGVNVRRGFQRLVFGLVLVWVLFWTSAYVVRSPSFESGAMPRPFSLRTDIVLIIGHSSGALDRLWLPLGLRPLAALRRPYMRGRRFPPSW